MDSEALPPIPTPPGQRWREFRIQVLPLFVFAGVVAALFVMWTNFVQPVSMVGMVETNGVSVVTTQAGLLTDLVVNRFDEVTNGQVLGQVVPYDAEQMEAQLAATASTINVLKARMDLNELGNIYAAANMQLNLDAQRTILDMAKVSLAEAERQVEIDKKLFEGPKPIITQVTLNQHLAHRDSLKSEVENRTAMVEGWVRQLETLAPKRTNVFSEMDRIISEDIVKQQEQLRQLQKPIVLRAPISGKVTALNHRAGERVPSGAVILSISSSQAEKIVAYVRQPINFHPKLGDTVTVRTRSTRRRSAEAQVLRVGLQMEPIASLLLPIGKPAPETGLPIALTIPPELNLLPGEVVDLKLSKQ